MLLLLLLRKHRLSFVTSMTRHFSQIYRVPHKAACLSLPHSQYERNKVSYTIILPQVFFFFFWLSKCQVYNGGQALPWQQERVQ